ncbi:MAG: signal peptide peptidase SppA [Desulfobacteraceae bacterium]|nr:signal peptide peptidase SppA [Desulfobacteraceae bacterium]
MTRGLFRHEHPIIFGLIVLGAMAMVFWAGVALFVLRLMQPEAKDLFNQSQGIGVVELKGVIMSPEQTLKELAEFREDKDIKAVVVRIDSPGGAVGAAQEIYQDIQRTAKVKPVVASMSSVAASGGYYAALGANEIFANPGTLTGSIGVIIQFANLEKLLDKVGYQPEVVKSGKNKDLGSFARPMTPAEMALMQDMVDNVHEQFIKAVADNRHLALAAVRPLADGRVFTGSQAQEVGLIDHLGNFTSAVDEAMRLAGLKGKRPHLVYPQEKNFSLLSLLGGDRAQSAINLLLPGPPTLMYQWRPTAQ